MLIQRQFQIAYAAIISAILVALGSLLFMHSRLQRMDALRGWSSEVVRLAFDCNLLGSESILQENSRSREQYATASAALQRLLDDPARHPAIARFETELRARKERMDQVVADFAVKHKPGGPPSREDYEFQTMLVSQWMLQTRSMLSATHQLRAFAVAESVRLRRTSLIVDVAAVLFIATLTGLIFAWSKRTLVRPLHKLAEGARRIGAGDLSYQLPLEADNELGRVAESFNAMARELGARQAEVDEKLRDLEAFSYSVAHDLKAPLRSVAGYSSLLDADYRDKLDEEGRAYLANMNTACIRMAALIDDLLQFGQLTHKQVDIHPVEVEPVCRQLVSEMANEIQAGGGVVECGASPNKVLGNEFLLKQALRNLIANGLKFVPPGRVPNVQIKAKLEGGSTRIEVRDNGIGIAPEHQRKIFGLFQRLHSGRDYAGTGIGLAIVQKCVERMRGELGVESIPGQGSVFWIKLPNAASG